VRTSSLRFEESWPYETTAEEGVMGDFHGAGTSPKANLGFESGTVQPVTKGRST